MLLHGGDKVPPRTWDQVEYTVDTLAQLSDVLLLLCLMHILNIISLIKVTQR